MSDPTAAEPKGYFGIEGAPMTGADPKDEQVERLAEDLRDLTAPEYIDGKPSGTAFDHTLMDAADLLESQARQIATLTAERDRAVEALRETQHDLSLGLWAAARGKVDSALAASQPSMPEPQTADLPPVTGDKT